MYQIFSSQLYVLSSNKNTARVFLRYGKVDTRRCAKRHLTVHGTAERSRQLVDAPCILHAIYELSFDQIGPHQLCRELLQPSAANFCALHVAILKMSWITSSTNVVWIITDRESSAMHDFIFGKQRVACYSHSSANGSNGGSTKSTTFSPSGRLIPPSGRVLRCTPYFAEASSSLSKLRHLCSTLKLGWGL